VVRKILSHAIKHYRKPTLQAEDQMLLGVAGEGGVGKTRVIKAVELRRKDKIILLAPTGAAAALSINMCSSVGEAPDLLPVARENYPVH
jgi:hypothetical protein